MYGLLFYRKAEAELRLRRQAECEAKAHVVTLRLITDTVTEEFLKDAVSMNIRFYPAVQHTCTCITITCEILGFASLTLSVQSTKTTKITL